MGKRNKISTAERQALRLIGGMGFVICGAIFLREYMLQKGVSATQDCIRCICPEEYAAINAKIEKLSHKEH